MGFGTKGKHVDDFLLALGWQAVKAPKNLQDRLFFGDGASCTRRALLMSQALVRGQVPFVEQAMADIAADHATPPGKDLVMELRWENEMQNSLGEQYNIRCLGANLVAII